MTLRVEAMRDYRISRGNADCWSLREGRFFRMWMLSRILRLISSCAEPRLLKLSIEIEHMHVAECSRIELCGGDDRILLVRALRPACSAIL